MSESEGNAGYSAESVKSKLKNEKVTERLREMGVRRAEDMWNRTKGVIAKHVNPEDKILDVGTGLGTTALEFAKKLRLDFKKVFTMDLGNILREPALKGGYVLAKGEQLPYVEGAVDAVLIVDVLHHTENPEDLIREAMRVAGPGGTIVIMENLLRSDLSERLRGLYKKALFAFDNTANAQEDSTNPHSNHTFEEWKGIFEQMGLEMVDHVEWQWGMVDFIPGMAEKGNREKPSLLRPFTDSVMILKVPPIEEEVE